MSSIANAEQLILLFKEVLVSVIDEVVSKKLAAIASSHDVAAASDTKPRERMHVSVGEAAECLGVSTQTIYRMHRAGELRFSKVRRRTFVPVAELERLSGAPEPESQKPPRVKKRHLSPLE